MLCPLPDYIDAKSLDKRLYRQASRKYPVLPQTPVPAEIPTVRKRPRRPNFPQDFKIALVEQSMQPGISVAQLARENNINDNLLFNWRHLYRQGLLVARKDTPELLPVSLMAETGDAQAPPPLVQTEEASCCELVLPAGTLRIRGTLTPELLQMLIREMQGGRQ